MELKLKLTGIIVALSLVLTACGGSDRNEYAQEETYPAVASDGLAVMAAPKRAMAGAPPPAEPDQVQQQYIAYTHTLGMRLPSKSIEPVMQGHIDLCHSAGLDQCFVTNSNLSKQMEDRITGWLTIRASEAWINEFMQGVDSEAAEAGGEIISRQTSAEDLTRTIIDTDARLRAQTTLKGRLEDLLATREGELADLLEIERELARVIGEVESITSNLKALQQRVSMQVLTVSYEPKVSPIAAQRFNPLAKAFGDFFYNLSSGLAGVINFFAVGLPWMFLVGLMLFIWLRMIWPWVRKRRAGKS